MLTVMADVAGICKFPIRNPLAKKDETPRDAGRDAPALSVRPRFLPDEIPLKLKSLFPLFSAEPIAPYRTPDKSTATLNMDTRSVRRGLSRRIEWNIDVTHLARN